MLLIFCAGSAQTKPVAVFSAGTEVYKSYRIPAIIKLKNGHLLAFAEGRVNSACDFGDVNLVMKRSKDKGKTWSALYTVVDNSNLQAGNPAPVVDLMDPRFPNGKIFLFYNTGNNHEANVRKGNGLREVWYISSIDGGTTWSTPRIIAISSNGGASWDTSYYDTHFVDPICQGSILSLKLKKSRQILAVCNNDDPQKRDNLTHQYKVSRLGDCTSKDHQTPLIMFKHLSFCLTQKCYFIYFNKNMENMLMYF